MTFTFPKEFWWGTATAAHQVEGGNVYNDIWLLEHTPGTIFVEPSGDAIDHYHRFAEDIALLADLGFNMYRFSLEWSRIEPEDGYFSTAALEHYRRMLAACHEHGITPMVTYHHFTSPRWLMQYSGWCGEKTPDLFARFCERTARYIGDLSGAVCTMNEINIAQVIQAIRSSLSDIEQQSIAGWMITVAQTLGVSPDQFNPFIFSGSSKARETILKAHQKAVAAIKSGPGNYPVGATVALMDIQAGPDGEAVAARMQHAVNDVFLEALRGDDFVGVQTYSRQRFGPKGALPPEDGVELTQMEYEFWPEALEATIRHAISVTGIPVIVTENGLSSEDDTRRVEYIQRALQGVIHCLKDGLDVRGYTYWSAFDNYEWTAGYRPKFGLIGVDRQTQERIIKPSARYLGNIGKLGILVNWEVAD